MKRMLVTGALGLLGKEIVEVFRPECEVVGTDLSECDVTSPADVRRVLDDVRPDVAVHCAAYTAVDRAESEPDRAFLVNGEGTLHMARACRERGTLLVTYGSDYVFDGKGERPYREEDPVNPLSVYGKSKLATEEALAEAGGESLLIRTQWLYGPHGRNFVFAILDRARQGLPLRVVSDQTGSPTHARDLAEATRALLHAGARGTFHFSNEGATTWHGFAACILENAFLPAPVELSPARTAELGYPAPRPAYSVLSKEKYVSVTGRVPRHWTEAVREFLAQELTTNRKEPPCAS